MAGLEEKLKMLKGTTKLLQKFHNERNETFLKGRRMLVFLTIYHNSPMTVSDLRYRFSEISSTVMTHDIHMLMDIGYIERTVENDMDQRQKSYELTERGFDVVDEWMEACVGENE